MTPIDALGLSKGRTSEAYVSVDVEASGPVPGRFSLLTIGACTFTDPQATFYIELQPIADDFVPEALQANGLSLNRLRATGAEPGEAMRVFRDWILRAAGGARPVFVGFNACFDWAFVNWYFHTFLGANPFGIGGIDIKSYYMGLAGCLWSETTSSRLPADLQPVLQHAHHARDDAQAQAQIFGKLLAAHRRR